MLSVPMPELTPKGVKAFAKTLRSHHKAGAAEDLTANLLADLFIHQSEVDLPTADGLRLSLPTVTWVLGTTGSGKTELAVTVAALAMQHPDRKVVYLSGGDALRSADLLGMAKRTHDDLKVTTDADASGSLMVIIPDGLLRSPKYTGDDRVMRLLDGVTAAAKHPPLIVLDDLARLVWSMDELWLVPLLRRLRSTGHRAQVLAIAQDRDTPIFQRLFDGEMDALIDVERERQPESARITFPLGRSVGFRRPPYLRTEADRIGLAQSHVRSFLSEYRALVRHLSEKLSNIDSPASHTQALEMTARLLGFSSWHSLQGYLQKQPRRASVADKVLSASTAIDLLNRHWPDQDSIWADRSKTLIVTVCAAGLDIESPTLLDDMIKAVGNPDVRFFLENLPGYPENREKMVEQFGYLYMPIRGALRALP